MIKSWRRPVLIGMQGEKWQVHGFVIAYTLTCIALGYLGRFL